VDAGVGALVSGSDDTVFIVTADHGGGGVTGTEHDEPHPANDHIPLIVAGPGVTRRHQLTRPISILDVPATIGSHVVVQLLKRTVDRPRPCDASGVPLALVDLPDQHSFPSGHAAAATAVAAAVAIAHPLLAPFVLPLAGVVAYSRVALRVHHVSDVLAGVAVGLAGAIGATYLLH